MDRLKLRSTWIALAAAAAFPCFGGPRILSAERPLLGLSVNLKEGGKKDDIGAEVLSAKALGVRLLYMSHKWSDLEPRAGRIDIQPLAEGLPIVAALGFQVEITIETLDTNNRTLPPDLMDKAFDAAEMGERFAALLERIAPRLDGSVRWVMLGNEADIYLGEHPRELEAYAGFIERGRERLRALRPGLAIGITTTHDGARDRPQVARRLNREMDVVAMTYYPLGPAFMVRPVSDVPQDFERMVRAAGGKPLLLQEVGFPADPLLGSSEEKQAAFVDAVFDEVKKRSSDIAFFNFFLLHDFPGGMVDDLLRYYRLSDPRFRAFLATLGLKKADGTPRKAWARFEERARAWSQTRRV